MTRVLFISDIHFKHSNNAETETLLTKLKELENYDFAVMGGDILDTHEKVDVQLLNKAYEMVSVLRSKTRVFICVGNHDMINNQQFLTTNHWMNGMKEWAGVTVVDKPVLYQNFIFVPYVYPGRLVEALETVFDSSVWTNATAVFAHQEIRGCKLGHTKSENGDLWHPTWPMLISGHIHERQMPQPNVLYPGSVITHAFGGKATEDQGLSLFTFIDGKMSEERVSLGLVAKKTTYYKVGDAVKLDKLNPQTRVVFSGTADEILAFKSGKQCQCIESMGVKLQFNLASGPPRYPNQTPQSFIKVLESMVEDAGDLLLKEDYKFVVFDN